jgi:dihydropteroate synthase
MSSAETELTKTLQEIDDRYSKRHIELDPAGYFIIFVDRTQQLICAKFFANLIDERGLAIDPATGKPIPAKGATGRAAEQMFTGRTAKELCIAIFEQAQPCPVSRLDHAAYIGREAQKAEWALVQNWEYVQD